jgi:hypothetical protein
MNYFLEQFKVQSTKFKAQGLKVYGKGDNFNIEPALSFALCSMS